jgi:nucleoside-diphosphate-sugar epimerase
LKKKILIVGGTGFLGYHLAKKCLAKDWEVTSISTNNPKKIRFLSKVKYLIVDISKKKILQKKIKSNYDFVVNFGGYVNHNDKLKTYRSHYLGCKNLADFFLKKKIKSFIQIGSCVEYGHHKSPQTENILTNIEKLKSTYGKAKLAATNYLLEKNKKNNFPSIILRLYLVYGPRQDFNRLIPLVIKGCLEKSSFPCSNGLQYRDFLYVDDVIDAIFKCFQNPNLFGEIINISSGKLIQIKKVILLIKKIIKKGQPDFGVIKLREDEILKLYSNIRKAKKKINWMPRIKFIKGLTKTINFYKKNTFN